MQAERLSWIQIIVALHIHKDKFIVGKEQGKVPRDLLRHVAAQVTNLKGRSHCSGATHLPLNGLRISGIYDKCLRPKSPIAAHKTRPAPMTP